MPRTTSFTLTEQDEDFITRQVKEGEHASASEVMREALRRYREHVRIKSTFYAAVDEGLRSTRAPDGVMDRVLGRYQRRHGAKSA